jgi:hypothetical protein
MRICCFLFVAFFFSFCSDLNQTKQLDQLKQLNASLDSIKFALKKSEKPTILEASKEGKKLLDDLALLIKEDTITEKEALTISAFSQNLEESSSLLKDYEKLVAQLQSEKLILNNLQKDISEGYGQRHKYNGYIAFEKIKIKKLTELSKTFILTTNTLVVQTKENSIALKALYTKQLNR